jgi:hypothetical protein
MNNHEFDDIIKQKAQQREADVPADIWNSISNEKEKRKRPFIWFLFLMLCMGGLGFFINIKIRESRVTDLAAEKANAGKVQGSTKHNQGKEVSANSIKSTASLNEIKKDELQTSQNINPAEIKIPLSAKNQTENSLVKSKKRAVIFDKHASFNSKNRNAENNSASKKSKQVYSEIIDATTAKGETNIFTATRKTRNSKGTSKVNILAGEMEVDQHVTNQDNSARDNVLVKEQSYPDNLMSDSSTLKQSQRETVVMPEIKSSIQGTADSAAIKKIIVPLKDSTLKNIDEQVAKKEKVNNKKSGLKIEVAIAVVSPLQHYAQPLYIKRTLTTANVYADFKTDRVQSTIEQGMGFNIHLVKSINKRTEAGAGIAYLRFTEKIHLKGIESKTNYTLVQRLVTGPTGSFLKEDTVSVVSKDSVTLNGRNVYNQLTMPVFIRYRIVNRNKWSCSITGGVNIDLIRMYHNDLPGKFETIYTSSTVSAAAKNSIGLGLSAGLHFSGLLYKKYQWLAATSFNYNLTPYTTNLLSSNKRIHLPGILVGISYQLKK